MIDILIIMNNYFHDVATATLLGAAVIMWVLERQARRSGGRGDLDALARAWPVLARFAQGALAWIVVGGIPRVLTFNTHDLGALRGDLVPAIAVKHVLEFAAVIAGAALWARARRRIASGAASADAVD